MTDIDRGCDQITLVGKLGIIGDSIGLKTLAGIFAMIPAYGMSKI